MKKYIYILIGFICGLAFIHNIVSAETSGGLTLPQGGLGITTVSPGAIVVGSNSLRTTSTTSPTVGYITATSTTASSTFANGLNVTSGCVSVNGNCIGGVGTSTNPFMATYFMATSTSEAYKAAWGPVAGNEYLIHAPFQDASLYDNGLIENTDNRELRIFDKSADNTGYISFFTGTTPTERARLTAGGNFAIGTTTPQALLHVWSNANAASSMLFENSNNGASAYAGVQLKTDLGSAFLYRTSSGYGAAGANPSTTYLQDANGGGIGFITNNGANNFSRLFITPAGKVAIDSNNTAPTSWLDIHTDQSLPSLTVGNLLLQSFGQDNEWFSQNLYYNSGWKYKGNGYGIQEYFTGGDLQFATAPLNSSGANAAASQTTVMTLHNNGQLSLVNALNYPTSGFSFQTSGADGGIELQNTGTGGHDWKVLTTNNSSGGGGGKIRWFDNSGGDVFTLASNGVCVKCTTVTAPLTVTGDVNINSGGGIGVATTSLNSAALNINQNPGGSPYFSQIVIWPTSSNSSVLLHSDVAGTNVSYFFGAGSGNPGVEQTDFRIVNIGAGVNTDLFDITSNGQVGIGTTTPYSKFQVTSGASATTTVNFGEVGITSSKACFNTKNTAGADISFYFVGTSMVVENNLCR